MLLSLLFKAFEGVVFNHLSGFLSRNALVDSNHPRAVTAAALSSVLMVYLSAAFDTVNHHILLSGLSNMGISDEVLSWFESYLSRCSFNLSGHGHQSLSHPLNTGVPQGSVLGLLFAMYTTSSGSNYLPMWFLISLLCTWHPTVPVISPRLAPQSLWRILAYLADISPWARVWLPPSTNPF